MKASDSRGFTWAEGLATLVAALCITATVFNQLLDTDLWQHLVVGRWIWAHHAVPTLQMWSWPTHGAIDTTSSYSWGFRALLWPVWQHFGVAGLYGWRWATTLAVFALLWATARTLGARGAAPLVVLVIGSLIYRQRSEVRPETLVSILIALQLWILERRRAGKPIRTWWLVGIAALWANIHVSYLIGLGTLGVHAVGATLASRGKRAAANTSAATGSPAPVSPASQLWLALGLSASASFLNPYGWRALAQPFVYATVWRFEPIYVGIGELRPVIWHLNLANGLPLLLLGWPLLQAWRAWKRRFDPLELALFAIFTPPAVMAERFLGMWVLLAVPYVARDLADAVFTWSPRLRPAWLGAAIAAAACVACLPAELLNPACPPGYGLVPTQYPKAACDFLAAHDIRGRGFTQFEFGGYMLWRFFPDPGRLPFMDIHQSGGAAERLAYVVARNSPEGWQQVSRQYRLDYVLAKRRFATGDRVMDFVDADSAWALVFVDDVAAVYVRRDGPLARVAADCGYRLVPGGLARLPELERRVADPNFRAALRAELDRMVLSSPLNSAAHSLRATLNMVEGRIPEAREDLEQAHRVDPGIPLYHQRLGMLAARTGDFHEALRCFEAQQRVAPSTDVDVLMGMMYRRLGDREGQVRSYRAALRRDPENSQARDSLAVLGVSP